MSKRLGETGQVIGGRRARIWLRKYVVNESAPFIATLAFNEDALNTGKDIYTTLAGAVGLSGKVC